MILQYTMLKVLGVGNSEYCAYGLYQLVINTEVNTNTNTNYSRIAIEVCRYPTCSRCKWHVVGSPKRYRILYMSGD